MVLKIPTPGGAEQLGNMQVAPAADTPFQKFSVPSIQYTPSRESDADARSLREAGGAVQNFAVAHKNYEVKKDKRALFSADAEQNRISEELLNNPKNGLNSRVGASAINHIRAGAKSASGNRPIGLVDSYDEQLAELRKKYVDQLSPTGLLALDASISAASDKFKSAVNQYEIAQQKVVDKQLTDTRMANAVGDAVAAVDGDETMLGLHINNALATVEAVVRDLDMGSAVQAGVTPDTKKGREIIDRMVKEQKAVVAGAVIEKLIAKGNFSLAGQLLAKSLQEGEVEGETEHPLRGTLVGSVQGRELQTALLTVQTDQKYQNLFNDLETLTGGDLQLMQAHIKEEYADDVIGKKHMQQELSAHLTQVARVTAQLNTEASIIVSAHLLKFRTLKDVDPDALARVSSSNPALVGAWTESGGKEIQVAQQTSTNAAHQAHVKNGGSASGMREAVAYFTAMSKEIGGPGLTRFIDLMKEPIKTNNIYRVVNFEEWAQLESALQDAENLRTNIITGDPTWSLREVLDNVGFDTKSKRDVRRALIADKTFQADIRARRIEVFEATGKAAKAEDQYEVIIRHALRIEYTTGESGIWGADLDLGWVNLNTPDTETDFYTFTQAEKHAQEARVKGKDSEFADVRNLPITTGTETNILLLGMYFGKSEKEIDAAIDTVEESDKPVTLATIQEVLGDPPLSPNMQYAFDEHDRINAFIASSGYPPKAIQWAINNSKGNALYNMETASYVIRTLDEWRGQKDDNGEDRYSVFMREYLNAARAGN